PDGLRGSRRGHLRIARPDDRRGHHDPARRGLADLVRHPRGGLGQPRLRRAAGPVHHLPAQGNRRQRAEPHAETRMDLELKGKIAVVTGTSVGLGREIAKVLAVEGVQTVVVARRGKLLAKLQDEIERAGGSCPLALALDLYKPDAATRIRDAALSAYGRVDILINNAGGSRPIPWDSPDAAWDDSFSINFPAGRRTTQALLPVMIERRWGRVLCVTGSAEPSGVNAAVAAKAG